MFVSYTYDAYVGIAHPSRVYNIRALGIPYLYIGPRESPVQELGPPFSVRHGDVDGVVRAMYRDPSGEPQHLVPGQVVKLSIDLGHIHHTFRAGHRIEVDVTSSNFPRRARNTNSGHPVLADDSEADIRVATNTVHHAAATPSYIELPVLEQG